MWWKNIIRNLVADYNRQLNEDKRNSPRFGARMLISFGSEFAAHETEGNIGIGGFFFQHDSEAEVGDEVDLLVDLQGHLKWVQAKGEVLEVVQLENGFGIRGRFTKISFEQERQLARWLDQESIITTKTSSKSARQQARAELSKASLAI